MLVKLRKLALANPAARELDDVDMTASLQDALIHRIDAIGWTFDVLQEALAVIEQHAGHPCQLVESCRVLHQPMQALGGQVRRRPAGVGDGAQWQGASLTE